MIEVNKKLLILGIIFFLIMNISGIYSLQSVVEDKKFSMGSVNVELKEFTINSNNEKIPYNETNTKVMPGEEISLIPEIYNVGDDCYVRVKIVVQYNGAERELDYSNIISEDWKLYGNYYYYNSIFQKGGVLKLFDSLKVPSDLSNEKQAKSFGIKIIVEAVQSKNFEPDYNLEDPWKDQEIEESVSKHFAIEDSVLGLTVKYENNSKRDVTVLDGFLDGLEKLMPGDTLNQLVEIENHSKEDMEYFLYMNNDGLTEREKELLGKITLKIMDQNNNVIYEGNLLEDKAIFLGKFAGGEKNNLIFEIKIPNELDDEFSSINIHSIWSFFAQEDKNDRGITKDNALFSPKTGDYEFELSIVIFFASSIGLIIVLFLNKKEKENMNRNKK